MKGVAVLIALAALFAVATADGEYAVAQLYASSLDGGIYGYVYFYQTSANNVTVVAVINNITVNPDALHGMHVHEFGEAIYNSTNTGTHFYGNGTAIHACPANGTNRSEGDMGNFQATGGVINQTKYLDLLSLSGPNSIIGRAVVLHALTDDCAAINSSGGRLAWGVIGIGNPSSPYVYNLFPNTTTNPATNDGSLTSNSNSGAVTTAVCYLQQIGTSGITGTVFFQAGSGNVTVTATINNLSNSSWHGFHIHSYGDLTTTSTNGLSLGGHYNPNGVVHGTPPNTPRHVGDMGNINYWDPTTNTAYYQYTNNMLSLTGAQSILGRAVVIHSALDDGCDPIGNSGSRLATCVIGIAAPVTVQPTVSGNLTQIPQTCATTTTTTTATTTTATTTTATTTTSANSTAAASGGATTATAGPTTVGPSGVSQSVVSSGQTANTVTGGSGVSGPSGPVTGGVVTTTTTSIGVVSQGASTGTGSLPPISSGAASLTCSLIVAVVMVFAAILA